MDQLHERCHAACAKAKTLVCHGVPEHFRADAQQYIGDLEERLRPGSAATSSANSSQDQLMLLTSSAVDLASLGLDVAIDLSKRVDTLEVDNADLKVDYADLRKRVDTLEVNNADLKVDNADLKVDNADLRKRVDALEEDTALLVLRELGSQCENKLYRLCVKVPMTAKDVKYASLPRLRRDKQLDPLLLEYFLSKWAGMEYGLEALKQMGGLAIAHPRQGLSPSKEELVSLVEKHASFLVKSDVLQVIDVLVDAAEKLNEPLFVPTM